MSNSSIKRFIWHWLAATRAGVLSSTFGYGSPIAAVIVGIYFTNGPLRMDQLPTWAVPLVLVAIAMTAVLLIHIIVGGYRAWILERPLRVSVSSGLLSTQYPATQHEPQRVALALTNKAYLTRNDCVVHIMSIDGVDNSDNKFPRFVDKFSIDSGETKQISILYRTFRQHPLINDNFITVAGPPSPAYNGNVLRISASDHTLSVRIGIPDTDPIDMRIRARTDESVLSGERV